MLYFCYRILYFFNSATIFTLFHLSACHSLLLTFSSPDFCVSLIKATFLLVSHSLLFLLFCCQSEADEDSEMRTQVHWAHSMALLSASHPHPHHKMHWATQHPPSVTLFHLSTMAYLLLLLLTPLLSHHTQTGQSFLPEFTSQTANLSLLLNAPLKLISQVLLFVNGAVMFIRFLLLVHPRVWFQSFQDFSNPWLLPWLFGDVTRVIVSLTVMK